MTLRVQPAKQVLEARKRTKTLYTTRQELPEFQPNPKSAELSSQNTPKAKKQPTVGSSPLGKSVDITV